LAAPLLLPASLCCSLGLSGAGADGFTCDVIETPTTSTSIRCIAQHTELRVLLYVLGPARLSGLCSHFPPFFRGHGHHSSLPADPTAFAAHCGHDAGYLRRGNRTLWHVGSGGAPDHLESCLVYVPAQSLWHIHSMPRLRAGWTACGYFKVAHYPAEQSHGGLGCRRIRS
jgi:hypothetical protein